MKLHVAIAVLLSACGDATGDQSSEASVCVESRTWQVEWTSQAMPVSQTNSDAITDPTGLLCYGAYHPERLECRSGPSAIDFVDDGPLYHVLSALDNGVVVRVAEEPNQIVVRSSSGITESLDCVVPLGVYASEGCIGVVASACATQPGPMLLIRGSNGVWSEPKRLPPMETWRRRLWISASGCRRFRGVWSGDEQMPGPIVVTVNGDETTTEERATDALVGRAFVDAATGDVVAIRSTLGTDAADDLMIYPAGGEPVLLDRTERHYNADDVPSSFGSFQFATTSALDTVVYTEQHGSGAKAFRVASRMASGWKTADMSLIAPDVVDMIGEPIVWSMAATATGELIVDLGTRYPVAFSHMRIRASACR